MARGVNKCILLGNLGADPDVRQTGSGTAVANLSLATSDQWTDRQGERQERTEWHRLVLWDKLAEIAQKCLRKGSRIYVEGKLQTRSWEDQSGQKRYATEIVVRDLVMLDGGTGGRGGRGEEGPADRGGAPQAEYIGEGDYGSAEDDDLLPF